MVSKKKRPTKKREKEQYPGLKKELFSKIKQQYWDYDYVDKLSEEDKKWLSTFTEEYLGARLNHKGKKLHRTKRLRKDCYDRNNARQRDIYSIKKVTGHLGMEDELLPLEQEVVGDEGTMIELIDSNREQGKEAQVFKSNKPSEDSSSDVD